MGRTPKPAPRSGLTGWGAAQKVLDRIEDQARRELLTTLCRRVGVQTAPGLEYAARFLRWTAGDADAPVPGKKLTPFDVNYIERRVHELLDPFAGDPRLPKLRDARRAA